ncbi:MAG: glycoside hydrolase family 38 C-terminal domain-containing protein [Clostridiaceae bacterium]
MNIKVPYEILDGFDRIRKVMDDSKRIKGYKFLIGDPEDAYLESFDDSRWKCSDEPVKCKRDQGTTWFRLKIVVPEKVMGIDVCGTTIRLESFFLAPTKVYVDGKLEFSERTWANFNNPEVILTESAQPGQTYIVAVKLEFGESCYFNGQFDMSLSISRVEDLKFEINSFMEELAYACRYEKVRDILPGVFELISRSLRNDEDIIKLVDKIKLSREMLRPMEAEAKKRTVHLIGHAHIDMNWFWSMEETLDLVRRDFGTMTGIMEEISDFTFSQSQCAAYEMAEIHYPGIFEKVKKFIGTGNWDVTASTWVEGDLNMASGEALARHFLYSKKYMKEKFGIEPRIMWNPDTFGHSANIPQIAKKAGVEYYFFSRCGKEYEDYVSDFKKSIENGMRMPLFWWEGLDGSRILAYNMMYNNYVNAANILGASERLESSSGLKNSMFVYGVGDHGGGPTRRDIIRAKQLDSYTTMPRIKFSTTHAFFDNVVDENSVSIPVKKGEMNYTFDGCYTTHADIKKYNRQCENMLVSTEILGTICLLNGFGYQKDEIEKCWKTALFNQFHDIFDGSGVKVTYEYSDKIARETLGTLSEISTGYMGNIAAKIRISDKGIPYIIFNPTGWERSGCIRMDKPDPDVRSYMAVDSENNEIPAQTTDDSVYFFVDKIPSVGYGTIYLRKDDDPHQYDKINDKEEYFEIETKYYIIEIKKDSGEITSLYNKKEKKYFAKREEAGWRLRNGVLNTLKVCFETSGPKSAWTISRIGSEKNLVCGAKAKIKEDGPVVKIICFEHKVDNSFITQDIIIYNDSPRIDFKTHVEWSEYGDYNREAPMLKACFIPNIDNQCAVYEIPFGAVERPCKDIEVPALKWMDISDESFGFSVLNDCKYGHKVCGNIMELTLIRSGWEPDRKSDKGGHDFIYSILPHKGDWKENGIIKEGYCLNNGLTAILAKSGIETVLPEKASYIDIDNENVAVSAFKPAESDNAVILRLYEGAGTASKVTVNLGFEVEKVYEVDLNEDKVYAVIDNSDSGFRFDIGKFEIKTFKLYLK